MNLLLRAGLAVGSALIVVISTTVYFAARPEPTPIPTVSPSAFTSQQPGRSPPPPPATPRASASLLPSIDLPSLPVPTPRQPRVTPPPLPTLVPKPQPTLCDGLVCVCVSPLPVPLPTCLPLE